MLTEPQIAEREQLRRQFKPDIVRILFVGESIPARGDFFYKHAGLLYMATQEAFALSFGGECGVKEAFLHFFQNHDCYLDDLCTGPVNHWKKDNKAEWAQRLEQRSAGIEPLGTRMATYRPQCIVVVMSSIEGEVRRAQSAAKLNAVPLHVVPFPVRQWRKEYINNLAELLPSLRGYIQPGPKH